MWQKLTQTTLLTLRALRASSLHILNLMYLFIVCKCSYFSIPIRCRLPGVGKYLVSQKCLNARMLLIYCQGKGASIDNLSLQLHLDQIQRDSNSYQMLRGINKVQDPLSNRLLDISTNVLDVLGTHGDFQYILAPLVSFRQY